MTADCLEIIHNGDTLPYIGIMIKRRPPTDEDYMTIKPKGIVSAEINVLDGYELKTKGTYFIKFRNDIQKLPGSNQVTIEIQ